MNAAQIEDEGARRMGRRGNQRQMDTSDGNGTAGAVKCGEYEEGRGKQRTRDVRGRIRKWDTKKWDKTRGGRWDTDEHFQINFYFIYRSQETIRFLYSFQQIL